MVQCLPQPARHTVILSADRIGSLHILSAGTQQQSKEKTSYINEKKQKSCAQPIMVYLYNDSNVNDDKDMCLRSLLLMDAKNFGG